MGRSIERRRLTPDVAFFTKAQPASISRNDDRNVAYPPFAPEIAFEVILKTDESADIEEKRANYLSAGSRRVVEVYSATRELRVWISSTESSAFSDEAIWSDASYPALSIRVMELFEDYDASSDDLGE